MSMAIKRARLPAKIAAVRRIQASGAAQGDPGLLGAIGGALKGAVTGFIGGGPVGAITGAVSGGISGFSDDDEPAPAPRPLVPTIAAPAPRPPSAFPVPQLPTPTLPGAGAIAPPAPAPTPVMAPGTNGRRAGFKPGGKFAMTPAGTIFPCPAGTRSNKSGYHLKSGAFIAPGTRCVKIRRRNPLNPRALDRAISRLESAKKASEKIKRITVRKKKKC